MRCKLPTSRRNLLSRIYDSCVLGWRGRGPSRLGGLRGYPPPRLVGDSRRAPDPLPATRAAYARGTLDAGPARLPFLFVRSNLIKAASVGV